MAIMKHEFGSVMEILRSKRLTSEVEAIVAELHQGWLQGRKGKEFQKQVLVERGWKPEARIGIEKRQYAYDGLKDRVAIEIEWTQSERVLADLLKLEYGFLKNRIDAGVIVNQSSNASRSPIPKHESGGMKEAEVMRDIVTVPIFLAVFTHEVMK